MKDIEILLLDADSDRRNNFASRLRVQGFNIVLSLEGFQTIHLIEKYKYSALIIIGNLQDMPGLEVLSLVRISKPKAELPIIFISTGSDQEEVLNAFELGANDIIVYSEKCFASLVEKLKKYKKVKK
ncbi:PleD family two-component system response regulator [Halobacteriovorax sp.]|uniref:response regulator n=1 Tax=Halobacteriovorax sp. TaxID=2020862 RepID=UPI003567E8D9